MTSVYQKQLDKHGEYSTHYGILALMSQPSIANDDYRAVAVDSKYDQYELIWEIEDYEAENDEDACNWDHFRVRKI